MVDRRGLGGGSLEIQEFQIVSPLVPFVAVIVVSRPWIVLKQSRIGLESLFDAEVEIVRVLVRNARHARINCRGSSCFHSDVTSGTQVSGSCLVHLRNSGGLFHLRRPRLVVLSSVQDKVICCTSLKFFVSDCIQMHCVILADARIACSNNEVRSTCQPIRNT